MGNNQIVAIFIIVALFSGCSTYKPQYKDLGEDVNFVEEIVPEELEIEKSFYLIGDAGYSNLGESTDGLNAFSKHIGDINTKDDYVIFLGDNIYQKGLPKKGHETRELAEHRIDNQLDAVKGFDGDVLFIPGNHDWYNDGVKGLKRQEEYIEKALNDNNVFQPENGCPIKKINITESIVLIVIDSEWYLTDWSKHPTINENCDIKTKFDFFVEYANILGQSNEKTVIVAMHHPTYTNGPHGGKFNFNKHIYPSSSKTPLPILGSIAAQLRATGGVSPQDTGSNIYNDFIKRLTTLAKGNDQVIFVSGHEHSLQYIENNGIKQIISGSGSKENAAALGTHGLFSYGGQGFAVLDIYKDGSSNVRFYSAENGSPEVLYDKKVYDKKEHYEIPRLEEKFPVETNTTVYKKNEAKLVNHNWFKGAHYRSAYHTDLKIPVARLDTLYGGLTPIRTGGGNQSRSLRLVSNDGRIYVMRAVKKSAVQFLQAAAFKNIYVENELIESLSEKIVLDFYTSGHPFGSLAIPDLSDAIGLYHANPKLFYVPKQSYLGDFNNVHGDELYIIEEHPDDTFIDVESFGKPDKIESTFDVLENIRKDEKYQIDEAALIKARVFDMLIGDWDRHGDQWRWSRFNISNEEVLYRPIPRDRDQVFSQFDGVEFDVLKFIIPEFKVFHEFSDDIKNVKWINFAGLGIDRAFLQKSSKEDWLEQARFIKENISDDAIDQAFSKLPLELQDETTNLIKENLRLRRANIVDITSRYYDYLSKLIVITATDKNDHIKIHRGDNSTKISVSRIKKGKIQKPYKERVISSSETKEIWVYGLGDKDNIEVNGNGRNPIFIRIVGGQDNDSYTINNGKRIKVYDHKSKPNTIVKKDNAKIRFSDIYENNLYDHRKKKTSLNTIFPSIGFNPDNGFIVKAKNTYIINGFKNKPYQSKYSIGAGYFFATKGLVIKLDATFTETFGKWNLSPGLYYASDYFTYNFFGFSNETENPEDGLGLDYNRVRAGGIRGKLGVSKVGHNGSRIDIVGAYENLSIEETEGRFITDYYSNNPEFFDQNFGYLNVDGTYEYSSYDVKLNPKRGFYIKFKTGVRSNYEDFNETYGYIHPKIEFYNSLTRNKKLVLKTMAQGQFNLGDDFEFFQAAVVGANTGLRGYREQRFSGKSAFAAGGDLRYSFNRIKTGFVPIQIGVFGGYDIGRVWIKEESSSIWHDNVGGGLWINVSNKISGQFGLFSGDENLRFTFGLGIDI